MTNLTRLSRAVARTDEKVVGMCPMAVPATFLFSCRPGFVEAAFSVSKTCNPMKNVSLPRWLTAMALLVCALAMPCTRLAAQQNPTQGITAPAQGNFMNADQAGIVLYDEVQALGVQLSSLTPGSPLYNAVRRKALYYRGIYMSIQSGNNVATSIGLGFQHLLNNAVDANGATKAVLFQLRKDAIQLLSN